MADRACTHVTCPNCRQIVEPVIEYSKNFETQYCPKCGDCISDVFIGKRGSNG